MKTWKNSTHKAGHGHAHEHKESHGHSHDAHKNHGHSHGKAKAINGQTQKEEKKD